jgi:hypothetical protein
MESYGLAAVALIGLGFYLVHRVRAFLLWSAAVVSGFAVVTYPSLPAERVPAWAIMIVGLLAVALGLSIVRVMLIRSVSLRLLAGIDGARPDTFEDEIRQRLDDMRLFHLVRRADGRTTLTRFGRLVAGIVTACYRALRIKT